MGKPYALKEWPDSSYIASLDSVVNAEKIEPVPEKATDVSMSITGFAPKLPGTSVKPKPASTITAQKPSQELKQAEVFAERFQKAMEKLQADPKNAGNYRDVTVKEGEDLQALLARIYGPESKGLALSVVTSQLSAVNGQSLSVVKPGQVLHVPKL